MKFWQKVFFPVLLLFLALLNGTVFMIYSMTYRNQTDSEKDRTASEQYALSVALARDMTVLRENDRLEDTTIHTLMDSYGDYYGEDGIELRLFRDTEPLYSEEEAEIALEPQEEPFTVIKSRGERTWVCAGGQLPNFEEYTLFYIRDITKTEEAWDRMLTTAFLCSLCVSILLAVLLLVIVNGLTRPLARLAKAADEVAAGDYELRVPEKGKDEIAQLARSFNHMTGEIRGHVEALEEDNMRKQQFLDNFTHELRTPLTNIYGYSEFMIRVNISEEDRYRYLDYIMRESKRLNLMSTELFNLTVLRNNETEMAPCSCQDILDAAGDSLSRKAADKGITIYLHPTGGMVYGNWALIQSLVNNLTENAIRACESGGQIVLRFSTEGSFVVLRVQDNGRGMTPDQLSRITEPFYRVDKSRTRADGGVGLGLYLCSEIVRLHGANLQFYSQLGCGTEVVVTFPCPPAGEYSREVQHNEQQS